jgi:GNAT superfamily N-acetyltransferase
MYQWLFEEPGSVPPAWDADRAAAAIGEVIDAPDATLLVAEREGELVGFCTAYLDIHSVRYGQRCWVEDLAVHPEHRSEGIGGLLLDAASAWARDRGASHLELDTAHPRARARSFYDRRDPAFTTISYAWDL